MPIANNSYVDMDSIGSDDDSALHCHTNNISCCNDHKVSGTVIGNWYSANGEALDNIMTMMASGDGREVYLSQSSLSVSRGQGVVCLLRQQQGTPIELGQLYCEVPDDKGVNKTLFINLSEL